MKNLKATLITATLITSLGLAALAPAVLADDRSGGPRVKGEQHQRMAQRGQHGMRGQRGSGGAGGFMHLTCSDQGAERLEKGLEYVSGKIELTTDQQELFDNFKTVVLVAQTDFADTCTTPARDDDTDMMDNVRHHQANMAAQLSAMEEIIPALESFHDSLTDEQKAELKPSERGSNDRGHRGGDRGRGHHNKG